MTYGYNASIEMDTDGNAETARGAIQAALDTKTQSGSPYSSVVEIMRASGNAPKVVVSAHLTTEAERDTFQTEVVSTKTDMIANVTAFAESTFTDGE